MFLANRLKTAHPPLTLTHIGNAIDTNNGNHSFSSGVFGGGCPENPSRHFLFAITMASDDFDVVGSTCSIAGSPVDLFVNALAGNGAKLILGISKIATGFTTTSPPAAITYTGGTLRGFASMYALYGARSWELVQRFANASGGASATSATLSNVELPVDSFAVSSCYLVGTSGTPALTAGPHFSRGAWRLDANQTAESRDNGLAITSSIFQDVAPATDLTWSWGTSLQHIISAVTLKGVR